MDKNYKFTPNVENLVEYQTQGIRSIGTYFMQVTDWTKKLWELLYKGKRSDLAWAMNTYFGLPQGSHLDPFLFTSKI